MRRKKLDPQVVKNARDAIKAGDMMPIYRPKSLHKDGWLYECIGEARVMTVVDGYAMLRFKGRTPFVEWTLALAKWKLDPPPVEGMAVVAQSRNEA